MPTSSDNTCTIFNLKSISRYNHTTDSCEGVEPGSPWQPALPDDTLFNSGEDDVLFFYGEPGKKSSNHDTEHLA